MTIDVNELSQIIRLVDGNHSLGAGALAEAILDHLPAPQIIRTVDELEALDPDTLVCSVGHNDHGDLARAARYILFAYGDALPPGRWPLPAVVVASGGQVRACWEALEGETT